MCFRESSHDTEAQFPCDWMSRGKNPPKKKGDSLITVDGSLKSGEHQLRLVVFPVIYRVSAPSQVVVWDFSHQQYDLLFPDS